MSEIEPSRLFSVMGGIARLFQQSEANPQPGAVEYVGRLCTDLDRLLEHACTLTRMTIHQRGALPTTVILLGRNGALVHCSMDDDLQTDNRQDIMAAGLAAVIKSANVAAYAVICNTLVGRAEGMPDGSEPVVETGKFRHAIFIRAGLPDCSRVALYEPVPGARAGVPDLNRLYTSDGKKETFSANPLMSDLFEMARRVEAIRPTRRQPERRVEAIHPMAVPKRVPEGVTIH